MGDRSLPDYYGLLQVHPRASGVVIKKAYRTLMAAGAHPDAGGSPEGARLLTEAYETLSDPDRRRAYDLAILMSPEQSPVPDPAPESDEVAPDVPPRAPAVRASEAGSAVAVALALTLGFVLGAGGFWLYDRLGSDGAPVAAARQASYHMGAAIASMKAGSPDEAEQHLRHAVALAPTDAAPLAVLGAVLAATDRMEAARDAYRRAQLLDPELAAQVRERAGRGLADLGAWYDGRTR